MAKKKIVVQTEYTVKGAENTKRAYDGIGDSANEASRETQTLNANTSAFTSGLQGRLGAIQTGFVAIKGGISKAVTGMKSLFGSYKDVSEASEETGKSTEETNKEIEKTEKVSKKAETGLGGLLTQLKAIALSPIGLVITALVGAFKFVTEAISGSEGASNKLAQGFSYLQGFIIPLQNIVLKGFELISKAVASPGESFDAMIVGIEKGVNYFNDNIIQPYLSIWKLMGLQIFKQITKIQLAWNELTGDVEESKELQDKLKEISKDIEDNQKVITDATKTLKEDVVGAIESVVEGVSEYVKEADKLGDSLVLLTKKEQNLLRIRRAQEVQNAKSLADIEALKLIRDNEAENLQERIKANEEIGKIESERVEKALSLAKRELVLIRETIKLKGDSTESLDREKEALISIQELRGESAGIESEQVVNRTALLTEEFEKRASLIDKENELLAIREQDAVILADAQVQAQRDKLTALEELGLQEKAIYIETQTALELAQATSIQARLDADIEASETKKALDLKNKDEAIELAEKTADQKKEIEKALGDAILNFASSLSTALGEESKTALLIQKTVALAQIGIDTAKAISSLTAVSSANPANAVTFGGAGAIQYATGLLTIGSNLAQAYSLLKQPAPTLGGGGGGASAPAPTTTQTAPDLGFQGQSAGSENFGAQTIIKAFVTESDITNSQTNANNIQQLSQIG